MIASYSGFSAPPAAAAAICASGGAASQTVKAGLRKCLKLRVGRTTCISRAVRKYAKETKVCREGAKPPSTTPRLAWRPKVPIFNLVPGSSLALGPNGELVDGGGQNLIAEGGGESAAEAGVESPPTAPSGPNPALLAAGALALVGAVYIARRKKAA